MVQENPPGNLNMATQSSPKKNPGNKENVSQEPSLHFPPGLHVANMVSLEPVKGVSQRQRGILGAVSNPVQLNSSQDTVLAHKGNTTQIYTFFFKEMYWLMKPGRTGDAETQAMWHDNAVTHSVLSLRVFVCVCVSLCLSCFSFSVNMAPCLQVRTRFMWQRCLQTALGLYYSTTPESGSRGKRRLPLPLG